jgi:glucosylceramidase
VNSDGTIVTVVMNQSDAPVTYRLIVGNQSAEQTIPARGIQTLMY